MGDLFFEYGLLFQKVAYRYTELQILNRVTSYIFQEAATDIVLFDDITEAELYIYVAISLYYMSYYLCFLFTQLIVHIFASTLNLLKI